MSRTAAQKRTLWKWVSIAFGAPAGVSFLSEINSKLDPGPIISQIVLSFDRFSFNVWERLGSVIGVSLETVHGSLSFCFLFFGVVIASLLGTQTEPAIRIGLVTAVELLSLSFLVVFIALPDDSISTAFSAFLTLVLFFLLLVYQISEPKKKRPWQRVLLEIVSISIFMLVLSYFLDVNRYQFMGFFVALLCTSVVRVIGTERLAFTKVAAFALGIFVLDKLSTTVVPAILDLTKDKGA